MVLRIQLERIAERGFPGAREYARSLGPERAHAARCCQADALVMHPGPMNRGVELASDVLADGPRSVILEQVDSRRRRPHGRAHPLPPRRGPGMNALAAKGWRALRR